MIIRSARAEDAATIANLWSQMIRDTLSTFTTIEKSKGDVAQMLIDRPGTTFLAEDGGQIAGFVTFGPFRSGPGYAHTVEHSIVLDGRFHGKGIGKNLLEQAQAAARALDHHVMIAAISSANPGAVAFHAKLGFAQTGHLPQVGRKAGQWLDLILMQKTL